MADTFQFDLLRTILDDVPVLVGEIPDFKGML